MLNLLTTMAQQALGVGARQCVQIVVGLALAQERLSTDCAHESLHCQTESSNACVSSHHEMLFSLIYN